MITVNLYDSAFSHLSCSVHGKTARRIRYVRSRLRWDDITLLTDDMLCDSRVLDHLESRWKVGWLLEPREYKPENYRRAEALLPRLDLLLTHDQALVDRHPGKVRLVPFGGCWVHEQNFGLHPKERRVSIIYSGKNFLPGHQLRHDISRAFDIDRYGRGTARPVEFKEEALISYKFSVVVENSRARNFFTEKLLDCFAVGTVPIYWGCPNLQDFGFDMRGVIPFDRLSDLRDIFADLDYDRHLEGVRHNLQAFRQYEITDDYLAEHVLEGLQ